MIIDFSVENYRSIRKRVTLSAVAQPIAERDDRTTTSPFVNERRKLSILPVVGIFGANASGKSNVLYALDQLLDFAAMQGSSRSESLTPMEGFAFTERSRRSPTKLAIRLLCDDIVYDYQLALNRSQIVSEHMSYIPASAQKNVSRLFFERSIEPKGDTFTVKAGMDLSSPFSKILRATTGNRTFLSVLIRDFNHPVTRAVANWLGAYFVYRNGPTLETNIEDCGFILDNLAPELIPAVLGLMSRFDTGISGLDFHEAEEGWYDVEVKHEFENKRQISWPISRESLGTQKLFVLATRCVVALQIGRAVVFDEFSASIHASIAQSIIKLFQNNRINRFGSQLFFASHDLSLQKSRILRRDQIWFTEKKADRSTDLFPLTAFGVRKDLVIEKAYAEGRFGAVPFLPTDEEFESFLVKAIHG